MATKRKTNDLEGDYTAELHENNPPVPSRMVNSPIAPLPEDASPDYDDVTSLGNILAELGADENGGGFVTIYRELISASGKRDDEYLDRYAAAEFSLAELKSRWGAGTYKISVYRGGGAGLATRKKIIIAKEPSPPVNANTGQSADLSPILAVMQQGFEKMFQAMQINATPPAPPAQSRLEMLQEMATLKEMFAPAHAPAPSYNPIELMKMGMEMANNAGGGGESNNAWVGKMIDQLAPVLMPAVADAINKPAPVSHQSAPVPRPAIPAPVAQTQQSEQEENPVNIIIIQYLNMLKQAAKKSAPVEEYADSILNTLPRSSIPELEGIISPVDWREKLRLHTTAADEFPEWFGRLRDTLLQYIAEDKSHATDSEPVLPGLTSSENHAMFSAHANDQSGFFIKPRNPTGTIQGG
jgi:hypothetical protein